MASQLLFKELLRWDRGQSLAKRRRSFPVAPCQAGRPRSGGDADGLGHESLEDEARGRAERTADGACGGVEDPRDEQRRERERQLQGEPEQERRLQRKRPRDLAGVEQPLGHLLDDERDRRQKHDQRRCRGVARLPAEGCRTLEHEPREQHAEAHGKGQRHVGEVRVAAVRERVCTRMRIGEGEAEAEPVPGDEPSEHQRRCREPRESLPHLLEWWQMEREPRTYNRRMAGGKPIAENRKARFDYQLLERFEAGLVLTGSEVKSLREGRVSLAQAYADVREGEAWLVGVHIDPYHQAGTRNHEPERDRKLLLHRRELDSLYGKVREKGLTLVPVRLYFKDGRAKVELALARGKEQRDKRRDIAKRESDRQIERALKARR